MLPAFSGDDDSQECDVMQSPPVALDPHFWAATGTIVNLIGVACNEDIVDKVFCHVNCPIVVCSRQQH